MRPARSHGIAAAAVLAAVAVAAPAARADVFATFDLVPSPAGGLDLRRANVATGTISPLPAGVGSAADEVHPALSPDRKRLVFVRQDQAAGTTRIIMVDLATGQSADLFSTFEAGADHPRSPVFSEDGTAVLTGRAVQTSAPSQPSFTRTDVRGFPGGPFPKTAVVAEGTHSGTAWATSQLAVAAGGLMAFRYSDADQPTSIVVIPGPGAHNELSVPGTISEPGGVSRPALSPTAGVIVFRGSDGRLKSRPLSGVSTAQSTDLPPLVNAQATRVTEPAFSADGRYLAFMRGPTTSAFERRLFVLDTQTQTLLNPAGIPAPLALNSDLSEREGAIDLTVQQLLLNTSVLQSGISFKLASPTRVGILVQRIVGTTRLLGRKAPKLERVGRVPFGRFTPGRRHRVRWDHKVNGKRLRRGRYLVTPRAVTAKGEVLDLGKPVRVTVS